VATAKARASEAAGIVAAHGIQTHGAIGYTEEYSLARFVRRVWQWRDDFGSESDWQLRLGQYYARDGSPGLTPDVFGSPLP
jgi:acyl-CoA dehydrogenase